MQSYSLVFGSRIHSSTPTRSIPQPAALGRANRVASASVTGKGACPVKWKSLYPGYWIQGPHCQSQMKADKYYFGRAVMSCIQATSLLYGAGQVCPEPFPPVNTPDESGGMVLGSFQR